MIYWFKLRMVRNYVRKTKRGTTYTRDDLEAAVDAVQKGHLTQKQAWSHFNIPQQTLFSQVKGHRGIKSCNQGRAPVIPKAMEEQLANGESIAE